MNQKRFEFLKAHYPLIVEALIDYWGEPCDDFEPECQCCAVWIELSALNDMAGEGIA